MKETLDKFIVVLILTVFSVFIASCSVFSKKEEVEVLIVGAGASGVAAGIQSARMGCNTLIVEPGLWLGGMLTSAGVSAVDGNSNLPGGIWGEFRDSLVSHYGTKEALKTGWVSQVLFEPSVGNKIFNEIVSKEKNLSVCFETQILSLKQQEDNSWSVVIRSGTQTKHIQAKIMIDASELGDVAKICGVEYDVGMESADLTQEEVAPIKANNIIQDLTYVAILKEYETELLMARPESYDSTLFACSSINELCKLPREPSRLWSKEMMISYGKLPNGKYMINWPIEGNDYYLNLIELSPQERKKEEEAAKEFTRCFIYFLQTELGFKNLGLADDEFPTEDGFPLIPYHRESRRIHGKIRFGLNDITHPFDREYPLYRTTIAVGDYPVDHHHARYRGDETLPDLHFFPIPSYGVPLGVLIPKDVKGLIVAEKSISVSNIVNGTTRLQPVVLQIGQAAGALAATAIKNKKNIDDVQTREVQAAILDAGGYLLPYLDVPPQHPFFKMYQRVGAVGVLRGEGRSVGWSNQTWLRCDEFLQSSDLDGLRELYPYVSLEGLSPTPLFSELVLLIAGIAEKENASKLEDTFLLVDATFKKYEIEKCNQNVPLKRGVFAVLIDEILDPFNQKQVDIYGNFKKNENETE